MQFDLRDAQPRFLAGVYLTCMCGLMLQIMHTRVLSIVSYYHMAFFAIGMAMMGMTAGALFVYFDRFGISKSPPAAVMSRVMVVFAWCTVASIFLLASTALTPHIEPSLRFVVVWAVGIAVLLPPYALLGMAISLALTRSPYPVGRVYGVDLVGAGSGCLVTLVLLRVTDTFSAIMMVGAVGAGAAWLLESAVQAPTASPAGSRPRRSVWMSPVPVLLLVLAIAFGNSLLAQRGLRPILIKGRTEPTFNLVEERWNSFSRVAMTMSKDSPAFLWSASTAAPSVKIDQGWLNIDGEAGTPIYRFDGDWSKLEFLKYDATAVAYYIRHQGKAAVIGVGGGRDLLTASLFGFRDVTGVEYNPTLVRLFARDYRDFSGADRIPGLHLVVDDARSWFARSREQFDLIQMSLIDTWAATGAGAFSLSESGLYTVDGWRRFMDRLSPDGVFTVSRWFTPNRLDETGRILSLAMATLIESGADQPTRHVFLVANRNLSTLVVGRSPLTESDLTGLREVAARLGYRILVDPGREPDNAVFSRILAARSTDELVRLGHEQPLDLSPSWDRNPFFFNQVRLTDPVTLIRTSTSAGTVVRGNLLATLTLVVLVLMSMAFTVVVVLWPARRSLRQIRARVVVGGSAYFILIGFGFMFAEMGFIQRMSVFLGHPVYGLAIVLFGLILFTGIGSFLAERAMPLSTPALMVWPLLLGAYFLAVPAWLPGTLHLFESGSLMVRVGVCLASMLPPALVMGFMFPTGMRLINRIDTRPTPWFWAVNGAAGVLGSGAAVLCSIHTSLDGTIRVAGSCYVLLAAAAWALGRTAASKGDGQPGRSRPPAEASLRKPAPGESGVSAAS